MIERIETGARMSKIDIYNSDAYLCGQVGNAKDDMAEQSPCVRCDR